MKKAFFVINVKVNDFEGYQKYIQAAFPLILKHGGMVKVADSNSKIMEGTQIGNLQVVIEFPNNEKAMEWYNDPEYVEAKQLRFASAETISITLNEEFQLPS